MNGRKKVSRKWKILEVRTEGKHLWNGCGSEAGRSEKKRTVKPSTRTWKKGTRNQAGEKGETEEARAKTGTGKASVRQNREEKERKNRRLSSWKRKRNGRKKVERKWKRLEVRTEGKHLWNGCGSETGKSEKKQTVKLSTGTWKEGTRNQAGEKGETEKARAESGTGKAAVRQNRDEKERKNRG